MPVFLSVVLSDLDLESLDSVERSSKHSHGSATRATNSDEHGIASLLLEDSRDSGQMLDAVLEEDEIHRRVLQVVEG